MTTNPYEIRCTLTGDWCEAENRDAALLAADTLARDHAGDDSLLLLQAQQSIEIFHFDMRDDPMTLLARGGVLPGDMVWELTKVAFRST